MTYKEYYLSLKSPEEIKTMANADMALACVINPDRMAVIKKHAEEAIDEKFGCKAQITNKDKLED